MIIITIDSSLAKRLKCQDNENKVSSLFTLWIDTSTLYTYIGEHTQAVCLFQIMRSNSNGYVATYLYDCAALQQKHFVSFIWRFWWIYIHNLIETKLLELSFPLYFTVLKPYYSTKNVWHDHFCLMRKIRFASPAFWLDRDRRTRNWYIFSEPSTLPILPSTLPIIAT